MNIDENTLSLFELGNIPVAVCEEVTSNFLFANQDALTLLHISLEEIKGKNFLLLFKNKFNLPYISSLFKNGEINKNIDTVIENFSQEILSLRISIHPITYNNKAALLITILNITDYSNIEKDLQVHKKRLELALEAADLDLWENNLISGEVTLKAYKTFEELGYPLQEIPDLVDDIFKIVHPDDVAKIQKAIFDHLENRTNKYRTEFRIKSYDGHWIWLASYGKIMERDSDGRGKRFIGVTFNIHDRKEREEEIARMNLELEANNKLLTDSNRILHSKSITDGLTGLFNRQHIYEILRDEMKSPFQQEKSLFIILLDIDFFKKINDTLGHIEGDRILEASSNAIKQSLRNTDQAGRYGGEEFLIVLPITDIQEVLSVSQTIQEKISCIQLKDNTNLTVSIGIAKYMLEDTATSFINRADEKLYKAKKAGRNRIEFN